MTCPTPKHRPLGVALILTAGIMLLLGQTLFKNQLFGKWFLLYWLACLLLTTGAMLCALFELRSIRRQLKQEQLGLLQTYFADLVGHKEVHISPQNQRPPPARNSPNPAASSMEKT